jgi:microcystin-dependent protein
MTRLVPVAAIGITLAAPFVLPRGAMGQASEPFLGQVMISGFNFCPVGWAPMNGQLMSIQQNTALFSLLGTTYGGDGKVTFALPTAKPIFTATGAPLNQCMALQGVFPPRN